MKEVYVKASDLSGAMLNYLPKQDIYSLDEIIGAFDELIYDYNGLEEEFEDYKEYVSGNMKPRDHWTASEMAEYYANEQ